MVHGEAAPKAASMHLSELLPRFAAHPQLAAWHQLLAEGQVTDIWLDGLRGSAPAVALASLTARSTPVVRPFLVVPNDEEEAGYMYHDLKQMLGEERVLFYPSAYRRAAKYGQRDAANEILRTEVLGRLAQWGREGQERASLYVVSFPQALCERVAAPEQVQEQTLTLQTGACYDLTALSQQLRDLGFVQKDYVYEPGEYAVRGSILDVFSYASDYPCRIDFFGDEVDSIRSFEVQTQLSRDRRDQVRIVPDVEASASGNLVPFTNYLPDSTALVLRDMTLLHDIADRLYNEGFARQAVLEREAQSEQEARERHEQLLASVQFVRGETLMRGLAPLQRTCYGGQPLGTPGAVLHFDTQPQMLFHKQFDLLAQALGQFSADGYTLFLLADSEKQHERMQQILADMGTGLTLHGVTPTLHEGFMCGSLRLCLFTDHQVFDRFHKYSLRSDHARDAKMALTLKEIMQFEPGDYVVHIDHGVGRFGGLVRMPAADGAWQEMIKITYRHDDAVFVSIHALHKVSKYKGREGEPPRITALGTGAWEKIKDRTKKRIKDIARDLIKLYAERRSHEGFAFSHDSFMQQELEAGFAYEDTPDQLRVTQEVKADMEQRRPMDRLVCGDVGFGKTEIAVRAAFKAAADNKQVAVLVPTTVLALQHYKTFSRRLAEFPVRVDYLSRARTAAQTKAVLADLAAGQVNILIGTHKLLGKQVKWHDLGLLIIDEEQKFGVAVKEKLRQLKVNVDTLTMSATPIPRTLQFSLMGARDFSVIQTPPPNRRPIHTEIHTFSSEVIAEAVNFEMSRNGQTYIVTHRVSQLETLAALVHKHVPDARIATGHGQMPPARLEEVVTGFVNHDYDVLISTTIVENGIDIPNANTIIIDSAHHFGLSDLHQMRGRVGRGSRKAFCYLLAPPLALLPDDARRRLQAIENFSDLGSGIHIAMQDLDIRGAGNLLGAEQSGFVADLGYETYQKILSEAVSELKNEEFADLYADEMRTTGHLSGELFVDDCTVECDLHAYFPETYVPGASERMMLYRELDSLESDAQIEAFRQRMNDRFGPLPPEGEELLRIVPLRALGRRAGAERMVLKDRRMTLYFVQNPESAFYQSDTFGHIIDFATRSVGRCRLHEANGRRRMVIADVPSVECALLTLRAMLPDEA